METMNTMNTTKELNMNALEDIGGGYIRKVYTNQGMGVYRVTWQVINDETGKVMITLENAHNAKGYARLMAQSTEELPEKWIK